MPTSRFVGCVALLAAAVAWSPDPDASPPCVPRDEQCNGEDDDCDGEIDEDDVRVGVCGAIGQPCCDGFCPRGVLCIGGFCT